MIRTPPKFPQCGVVVLAALGTALPAAGQVALYPPALAGTQIPEPPNLVEFVQNRPAAIALGKALFWDTAIGSDGQTACATCHGQAGVDPRRTNMVHPGPNGTFDLGVGPGGTKSLGFFPTVQFADPRSRFSARTRDADDIVGSQGVLRRAYRQLDLAAHSEACDDVPDPVFHADGANVRQVTSRNPPSIINAVFNVRNFWDGRANAWFNGVNGLGPLDPGARVWRKVFGSNAVEPVQVMLQNASLASQAVGPVTSGVEMSCSGRTFPNLAARLLDRRALAGQRVASTDSVLGSRAAPDGFGLASTYRQLIAQAFREDWRTTIPTPDGTPQVEANFPLLFGIALQMYQATLVSDQTRYDQWRQAGGPGSAAADALLTAQERRGLDIFVNDGTLTGVPVGNCAACHATALFSKATWPAVAPLGNGGEGLPPVELMASAAVAQTGGATFTNHPLADAPAAVPLNFVVDGALVELYRVLPPPEPGDVPGPDDVPLQASVQLPDMSGLGCPTDVARSEARTVQGAEALFSVMVRKRVLAGGSCGTSVVVRVQGFLDGIYQIRFNGIVRATTIVHATGAYDIGFYNIGVRPTPEDVGQGGLQAGSVPLSFARRRQQGLPVPESPAPLPFVDPAIHVQADGVFKTPSLRNVELTGPYFHNGGQSSLRQVLEFYNRGGDFHEANILDLSPEMFALQLSDADLDALVAFLKTLTDHRVRDERPPFDHPELPMPNGEHIPAVGALGRAASCIAPLLPFDEAIVVANTPPDCDGNGRVDSCEIAANPALDQDGNGVPDACQCVGDVVADGYVDGQDLGVLLMQWGSTGPALAADLSRDGVVDGVDLGLLLVRWGPCTVP